VLGGAEAAGGRAGGGQGLVGGGQAVEQDGQRLVAERAEGGGDELLDLREELVEHGLGVGRDVDQDPAPVNRVGLAPDVALAFEGVQDGGHRRGGDMHPGADLARGERAVGALDDSQGIDRGVGQPVAAGDIRDEGLGAGAGQLELAHDPHVEPPRARVLVLEGLGFGRARRSGDRSPGATSAVRGRLVQLSLHGELDPRRAGQAGAGHRLPELTAAGERLGGFQGGEPVDDDHVVVVAWFGQHLGAELLSVTDSTRSLHGFELESEVRDWLDSLSDSDCKLTHRGVSTRPGGKARRDPRHRATTPAQTRTYRAAPLRKHGIVDRQEGYSAPDDPLSSKTLPGVGLRRRAAFSPDAGQRKRRFYGLTLKLY
jgi:hypothetical protein